MNDNKELNAPVVSVIIPVYNGADTVERCVTSLLENRYTGFEIILIEDCSKDDSWKRCVELSKRYEEVRCFQNERNKGVSHTRNCGLAEAKGKYILFVDCDDWVAPHYVESLVKASEEDKDCLVICGFTFMDERTSEKKIHVFEKNGENTEYVNQEGFWKLADNIFLQQLWTKIFRRDIIVQHHIRFDESQSMGEDFEFVLDYMKAAEIKRCCVINEPLYYYIRANNTSLMSKFGLTSVERSISRFEKLADIAGRDNPIIQAQLQQERKNQQKNAVYFIARSKETSIRQKLKAIEDVMQDGRAMQYLLREMPMIGKEILSALLKQ